MGVFEFPTARACSTPNMYARPVKVGDGGRRSWLFCKPSERLFFSSSKPDVNVRERLAHSTRASTHAASLAPASKLSGRKLRMPSTKELATVKLPALECSFPSEVHPDYEQIKGQCDEWIERVAQPPTPDACRFLRNCLLPKFVCRFMPRAPSGPRLLQSIKLVAWLMIGDDDDDHPDFLGSNYASTSQRASRIMAILTRAPQQRLSSVEPLSIRYSNRLDALADLWQDIYPEMSPFLRSRFTSSMADYLEGIKMQATFRHEGFVPNVQSYIEIRRQASFTIPASILLEYASGVELDQVALGDAHVVELLNKAVDYISLCNDIFSCYKEISVGDYFNLPSILYTCGMPTGISTTTCTSLQDAVDHVVELTQDLNASCTSHIASIKEDYSKPSIDPKKTHHIHVYTDFVALGMSGALAWFSETPRYQQHCT